MMTEAEEILSALIDREAVDPDALARLLEQPEARLLLVDFVRLRAMVSDESSRSEDGDPLRDARVVRTGRRWSWHPRMQGRWARAAGIVLIAAGGVGGGVWLGQRQADVRPPTPAHVVQFEPGVDWQPIEAAPRQRAGK